MTTSDENAAQEVAHLDAIVHGEPTKFTKERIIQFVLANANPSELAGIAGVLAGQAIHKSMTGEYREL